MFLQLRRLPALKKRLLGLLALLSPAFQLVGLVPLPLPRALSGPPPARLATFPSPSGQRKPQLGPVCPLGVLTPSLHCPLPWEVPSLPPLRYEVS